MGNAARTPLKQYLEAGRLEAGCDEAGGDAWQALWHAPP